MGEPWATGVLSFIFFLEEIRMKKLIAFILAFALAMSLVACASTEATQECEPEERFAVAPYTYYLGVLG